MRTARTVVANSEGRTTTTTLRQRILDEAIDLVSHEGGESITMRALANRLGYSPATIYLHFRNKDELREEVARHGFAVLSSRLEPAAQFEDAEDALREIARRYVDFALETPALYRLMFGDLNFAALEARGGFEVPGKALADAIRDFQIRGIEAGAFRAGDPEEQSAIGWSMLHGFALLTLDGRMPPPRLAKRSVAELRDALIEAWLRALRP